MKKPPSFIALDQFVKPLTDAGLPLPVPLSRALKGDFLPLALDTRDTWPLWAIDHGYDETQLATLNAAVARLVNMAAYRRALAEDLSCRHDVDGRVTETVSYIERNSAAMMLLAAALRETGISVKVTDLTKPPSPEAATKVAPALVKASTLTMAKIAERRRTKGNGSAQARA